MQYTIRARNLSHASENKIHDDGVARRFGFQGGLVPGVEVYAYMTHLPVARWGVDWLERGTAECRFSKPVYDAKIAIVSATDDDASMAITVESEGGTCATGSAALPDALEPRPNHREVTYLREDDGNRRVSGKKVWSPAPAADHRPPPNEETLAVGRRLSSLPVELPRERLLQYLADIGETEPLYAREALVHPAFMLRLSNLALKDNVKLDAWIHAGSSVRHCGLARAGDSLQAHAEVAANYERNGHRFVDLDVTVVANEDRAVAQVRHTAIYRLRQS